MDQSDDAAPSNGRHRSALSGWHPLCYQRAAAFVTDPGHRLLVFEHLDVDAGTQVPGGGIHAGESASDAVVRELAEESGIESAAIVRQLGEAWGRAEEGTVPGGLEEHVQHAFHLHLFDGSPAETWEWNETSGGDVVLNRFRFRWISLADAERLLWPNQAMWISAVGNSLRHL